MWRKEIGAKSKTHAQNQSDSVGSFDRPGVDIVVHQTAYPRALVMLLVLLRFPARSFVLW